MPTSRRRTDVTALARRRDLAALACVLLVALALRLPGISARSLWFDEAFSWRMSTFPATEIPARTAQDYNPPLYYLLLKGWMAVFGETAAGLRGLSVLCGLATVVGAYLFAREAFGNPVGNALRGVPARQGAEYGGVPAGDPAGASPSHAESPSGDGPHEDGALRAPYQDRPAPDASWIGVLAAALVAVAAAQVHWSREARMYALGTALVALSSWAMLRALRIADTRAGGAAATCRERHAATAGRPCGSPWRSGDGDDPPVPGRSDDAERGASAPRAGQSAAKSGFAAWTLFVLLDVLFLYTHSFAPLSVASQAAFIGLWLAARHWGDWRGLVRAARAPALAGAAIVVLFAPWVPAIADQSLQARDEYAGRVVSLRRVADVAFSLWVDPASLSRVHAPAVDGAAAAMLTLGMLAAMWRRPTLGKLCVFCLAAGPLALVLVAGVAGVQVLHARYLPFAQVFMLVALAVALLDIRWLLARRIWVAVALVVLLANDVRTWHRLDAYHRPGARGAAAHIDAARRPGEPVIAASPFVYHPLAFHSRNRAVWQLYDDGITVRIRHHGTAVLREHEVVAIEELERLAVPRVWIVGLRCGAYGYHDVPVPADWEAEETLDFREIADFQGDVVVTAYVPRLGGPRSVAESSVAPPAAPIMPWRPVDLLRPPGEATVADCAHLVRLESALGAADLAGFLPLRLLTDEAEGSDWFGRSPVITTRWGVRYTDAEHPSSAFATVQAVPTDGLLRRCSGYVVQAAPARDAFWRIALVTALGYTVLRAAVWSARGRERRRL